MQDADVDPVLHDILREASGQPALAVQGALLLRDIPGWDSVTLVGAILSVEDRFGIEFQRDEFAAVATVDDLAAVVRTALAEAAHG